MICTIHFRRMADVIRMVNGLDADVSLSEISYPIASYMEPIWKNAAEHWGVIYKGGLTEGNDILHAFVTLQPIVTEQDWADRIQGLESLVPSGIDVEQSDLPRLVMNPMVANQMADSWSSISGHLSRITPAELQNKLEDAARCSMKNVSADQQIIANAGLQEEGYKAF